MPIAPKYDLRQIRTTREIRPLFEKYHGYKSLGRALTYAFAVFEDGRPVAAYVWQPPAPGAAKAVCPEFPAGVLALSRMVAVPRAERDLNHVSKPLRRQMRTLIDRGRWPALVTYSDASLGHSGHVYKCSGWERAGESKRAYYVDTTGARRSTYSAGRHNVEGLTRGGTTTLTRWEHWICDRGTAAAHAVAAGWRRVPIPGKFWRSGNQRHKWAKI